MITLTQNSNRLTHDTRTDMARALLTLAATTPTDKSHVAEMRDWVLGRAPMPELPARPQESDGLNVRAVMAHRLRGVAVLLDDDDNHDDWLDDSVLQDLAGLAWSTSSAVSITDLAGVHGGDDGIWTVEGAGYVEETEWGFVWKREHELFVDAHNLPRGFHRTLAEAVGDLRANA